MDTAESRTQAEALGRLGPFVVSLVVAVFRRECSAQDAANELDFITGEDIARWASWVAAADTPDTWPKEVKGFELDCARLVTCMDGSRMYARWDEDCGVGGCFAL